MNISTFMVEQAKSSVMSTNLNNKKNNVENAYLPDFLQNIKEDNDNIYINTDVYLNDWNNNNNWIVCSDSLNSTATISYNNSITTNRDIYVNNQYIKNVFCSSLSSMYCNETLANLITIQDYSITKKNNEKIYFIPCEYQDFKLAFEIIFNAKKFSHSIVLYVIKDFIEKIDITNFSVDNFLTVANLVKFESDYFLKILDVISAIKEKTEYIKNCKKYNELTGFNMKKILSYEDIDIYPLFDRKEHFNFYYDFDYLMIKNNKIFYPESFNDYLYYMQIAREKFYKHKKKKKIADDFYFLYYTDNDLNNIETKFYSSDFVVTKNNYDRQYFIVINDLLCFFPISICNNIFSTKVKENYEKQKSKIIKDIEKRMTLDNILSSK